MRGILLINKAKEMTSHDVVAIIRSKLKIKRVGHTGTLDPMVTGVLPICIGSATRVSQYIMEQGKKYHCTLKFGKSTTTYDAYGEDVNHSDKVLFSKEEILKTFEFFTGEIHQKPPIYSAVKIDGKRLYKYARDGKDIEIPSRKVNIYKLELVDLNKDYLTFNIHCSKGTYVRSLVHDIGLHLGTFAYMDELVRTDVGCFNIKSCIDILDIKSMERYDIERSLISIEDSLYNLASIYISDDLKARLCNGQRINLENVSYKIQTNYIDEIDYNNIKVFVKKDFLGIGSLVDNILKMERVLNSD